MPKRPGGAISKRNLYFIWLVDCSTSMKGENIQSLNQAIRSVIPVIKNISETNMKIEILMNAIKFSNSANWHLNDFIPIEKFSWEDLNTDEKYTDMGKALSLVANFFVKLENTNNVRGISPILVLVTDGNYTDNFKEGLEYLLSTQWGKKAVKVGIKIGEEAREEALKLFIDNPTIPILTSNNPETLKEYIKYTSTAILKSAGIFKTNNRNSDSLENINKNISNNNEDNIETW